ncbi:MAG: serine/threonine protein kinase, partial [Planctomycetales bacterium]|nr:serine/threonine protein kinase [Planctomycetales bacterium]
MASKPLSSATIDAICDQYEATCRSGSGPSIEEHLRQFDETDAQTLLRELLLVDHQFRSSQGTPPTETEYLARFPAHAFVVQEVLCAGLGHAANTKLAGQQRHEATALFGKDESLLEALPADDCDPGQGAQLGDYEVLGELGRGGMGIVFRARQNSVGRIVALKILRRDKLNELAPDQRATMIERFRLESQSAAHLDHDHIVPVYEVGEADGVYYYSMRFVDGQSLADLIKERPLENRAAAELIEPVARALDIAHRRGVLHRDIKPRNIMVEAKTGRPMLTDFGLAKLTETQRDMTHTGDVMGSPPYMSPEQATDAARVTAGADIYSLGATLYHLLAGRPPFQAATVAETLRQVWFDEPIAPRQLNPAIDRDLETICLKCLEKEPGRRFATAGEMADELARFLRGEPLKIRPVGQFGRLRRWCRRNPLVAGLGAAVFASLLAVAIISSVAYFRLAASAAREREMLQEAGGAVGAFTSLATSEEEGSLKAQGLDDVRRQFLDISRQYYDRFVQHQHKDKNLEVQRGKAYGHLADIHADLGEQSESLKLYREAIKVFDELAAADPADPQYLRLSAAFEANMAALHRDLGQRDEGEAALGRAYALGKQLLARDPTSVETLALVAHIQNERAVLLSDLLRYDEAEEAWLSAVEFWKQLTPERP